MRSHSQFMIAILTVSFAMSLALCVALLCITQFREPIDGADTTASEETSVPQETSEPLLQDSTEETTDAPTDELGGGLRYLSDGNGRCKLVSVGSCVDACVVIPEFSPEGDRVTEIAERAFYGCSTVTAVQIPATVQEIGELAFAGCANLVYISVSPQNPAYLDIDGVLYTADQRVLIQYPAKRAGQTMTIQKVTVEIAEMAFYQCAHLEQIEFIGRAAEWESIRIGAKNYSLTAASKRFTEDAF